MECKTFYMIALYICAVFSRMNGAVFFGFMYLGEIIKEKR